jgi:hypothetical protein
MNIGAIFFVAGFLVSLAAITPNFIMLIIGCSVMSAGLIVMQTNWGE